MSEQKNNQLDTKKLLGFATLTMPLAAVEVPLGTYLPPLYSSAFGFDLATLGLIFLVARLFDGVIDPLIGVSSDRTRTKIGRRKPWIIAGAIIFFLFAIPIFFPPQQFGSFELIIVLLVFYAGYSMIATPYAAWSGELSAQYHERTRISTYLVLLTSIALLLALLVPTIVDLLPGILRKEPEVLSFMNLPQDVATPEFFKQPRVRLAAMALMTFALFFPAILLVTTSFKEPQLPPKETERLNFRETITNVFSQPLLLRVLGSNFAVRLAQGTRTTLFVFFVSFYVGKPEWAAALFLFQYSIGIFAAPIWLQIGKKLGKHRAAVLGETIQVLINFSLIFISRGGVELLIVLTIAQALAQGSGNLMLRAIVADAADHHQLETGKDRKGLFFSTFTLSEKLAQAAAIGIAFPLVAFLGFDPKIENTDAALSGLKYVFALGPALGHLLSAIIIAGYPLDEKKFNEVRAGLATQQSIKSESEEEASSDPILSQNFS